MGEMGNAYKTLSGNPLRKESLGKPRSRWEDNIKTYFKEVRCEKVDWIHLAEDRVQLLALVNTIINL
jgi:hypothetical protein